MRISVKNLIPSQGKLEGIWKGVVEDNKDPEKRGRVRIRVIGIHTDLKQPNETSGIPTEALPWAEPVMPFFEGAISGLGVWYVPVQGSHVYLFFEGNNIMQPRYFASSPGIPKKKANPDKGFNDPDGVYPLEEMIGKPDWHPLARGEEAKDYDKRKEEKLKNVKTSKGEEWEEPDPYYFSSKPTYPNNIVISTRSKFLIEIDNTKDGERFSFMHPKAYFEINKDGELVFRNKADRYDICDGILYKYCKEDKNQTVEGEETSLVKKNKDTKIGKEEKRVVGTDQKIAVKESQIISVLREQKTNIKGTRSLSCWGSEKKSVKGSSSWSVLGAANLSIAGLKRSSITGFSIKSSMGPNNLGSQSSVLLGRGPISKALASLNSALSGLNAAIMEALQPILDAFNAIQEIINQGIAEIMNFVNEITQPLVDIINEVQSVIETVKNEFNSLQEMVKNVMNAPFQIMSSITNYINKIINTPGYIVQNIINQIAGIPAQLNVFRAISSLYMTACDINNIDVGLQVEKFNSLFNGIFEFQSYSALGDTNSYGRSGLSSYENGVYKRTGIMYNDYYMIGAIPSATTTWGQYKGSGTLTQEVNQAKQMVEDVLRNCHYDEKGNFQIRSLISVLWTKDRMYDTLIEKCTIRDLLGECIKEKYVKPDGTVKIINNCIISPLVLDEFGYVVESQLLSGGWLTEEQKDHKIPTIESLPLIPQDSRSILFKKFSGDARTIKEIYDLGEINIELYQSLKYEEEEIEDFEKRMEKYTPYAVLNSSITPDILEKLNKTKENLYDFAEFNTREITASYADFFEILISVEDEIVKKLKTIDLDSVNWTGKDDDFEEAC